ncbi:hypothetical protein ACFQL4_15230 [Halosimplex aquaticum]
MEYGLVLWWLVAYLAFMAVGMPLAAVLFPRLADRGAGVALPTALAVPWIVAYLVGHVSLTAGCSSASPCWRQPPLWPSTAALSSIGGATAKRPRSSPSRSCF